MASKTEICNRALAKVGDRRVSNIETDTSERAQALNDMYDSIRLSMLRNYPWNFAIKRTQLAVDATAPSWGYAKRYQLPSDFLALLEVKNKPDYRIESGYILTDEGAPLYIKYVRNITDTGEYDPLFDEAFAAELAVELCERLTQSNTKKKLLLSERDSIIKRAFAADAIADPPQELEDDEWLLSRESSVHYDNIDYNV